MKVLYINVTRSTGSTGKIISSLGNYVKSKGGDIRYCYREGKVINKVEDYKVSSWYRAMFNFLLGYLLGFPYGVSFISTLRVIRIIKKEKPDIVHLHSINSYYINIYILIKYLKTNRINTVVTNHSEYLYTGNCTHSFECNQWEKGCVKCKNHKAYRLSMIFDTTKIAYGLMEKAFQGFKNCIVASVSPWVYERSSKSNIMNGIQQDIVENGINENIFKPKEINYLKEKYGLKGKKVILFSTARFSDQETDNKGGKYIIKIAKLAKDLDIKVIVVALRIKLIQNYDNIICIENISNDEKMAEFYSLADVVILASKRETFSMVAAEALMCGTPICGFYSGGPESIAIPEYSRFCEYGNYELLFQNALELLNKSFKREIIAKKAREKYNSQKMCEQYYKLYMKLLLNK